MRSTSLRLATTHQRCSPDARMSSSETSSVSCLYGIGSPEDFHASAITIKRPDRKLRNQFLRRLLSALHSRNDTELARGTFRVKGDTIDIRLAYEEIILRVVFWGDEIESITTLYAEDGVSLGSHDQFKLYPANIFRHLHGHARHQPSPKYSSTSARRVTPDFRKEARMLEAKRLLDASPTM